MRKFATQIKVNAESKASIVDTCGTGGDKSGTFNISTATAFVVSACGLIVAKHGNRSVSSSCGSADVLEALGVNLNVKPEKAEECLSKIGIGFLFAPALHEAMKYAIGPRRQIGIRTVFNILGPLTNPAGANSQVLGVFGKDLVKMLANVLKNLGTRKAWVVHGKDGLDEISITGPTYVAQLNKGRVTTFSVTPKQFGLKTAKLKDIKGGSVRENAQIIRDIFSGKKGAKRDIVLLNSAACLFVADKVKNIKEGLVMAQEAIDSGKAAKQVEILAKLTNE
jgi:anthranilate phosphoribosyltransferase